jgi:hypothetical protein
MEKQTIYINYAGSGIKTLRIIGFIAMLASIPVALFFMGNSIIFAILALLAGLLFFALGNAITCIAENSLFAKAQRDILLQKQGIQVEFQKGTPPKAKK